MDPFGNSILNLDKPGSRVLGKDKPWFLFGNSILNLQKPGSRVLGKVKPW